MSLEEIEDDLMAAYRKSKEMAAMAEDVLAVAFYNRLTRRILLVIRDMRNQMGGEKRE